VRERRNGCPLTTGWRLTRCSARFFFALNERRAFANCVYENCAHNSQNRHRNLEIKRCPIQPALSSVNINWDIYYRSFLCRIFNCILLDAIRNRIIRDTTWNSKTLIRVLHPKKNYVIEMAMEDLKVIYYNTNLKRKNVYIYIYIYFFFFTRTLKILKCYSCVEVFFLY